MNSSTQIYVATYYVFQVIAIADKNVEHHSLTGVKIPSLEECEGLRLRSFRARLAHKSSVNEQGHESSIYARSSGKL